MEPQLVTIQAAAQIFTEKTLSSEEKYPSEDRRILALCKLFGELSLENCIESFAKISKPLLQNINSDRLAQKSQAVAGVFHTYLQAHLQSMSKSSTTYVHSAPKDLYAAIAQQPYPWKSCIQAGIYFWNFNPNIPLDHLVHPNITSQYEITAYLHTDFKNYCTRLMQLIYALDMQNGPFFSEYHMCKTLLFSRAALCHVNPSVDHDSVKIISWAEMILKWRDSIKNSQIISRVQDIFESFRDHSFDLFLLQKSSTTHALSESACALPHETKVNKDDTNDILQSNSFTSFLARETVDALFNELCIPSQECTQLRTKLITIFAQPTIEIQLSREYISVYVIELYNRFIYQKKSEFFTSLWKELPDHKFAYLEKMRAHICDHLKKHNLTVLLEFIEFTEIIFTIHLYKQLLPTNSDTHVFDTLIIYFTKASKENRQTFTKLLDFKNTMIALRHTQASKDPIHSTYDIYEKKLAARLYHATEYVCQMNHRLQSAHNTTYTYIEDHRVLEYITYFATFSNPKIFYDFLTPIIQRPDCFSAYVSSSDVEPLLYQIMHGIIFAFFDNNIGKEIAIDLDEINKLWHQHEEMAKNRLFTQQAPLHRLQYILYEIIGINKSNHRNNTIIKADVRNKILPVDKDTIDEYIFLKVLHRLQTLNERETYYISYEWLGTLPTFANIHLKIPSIECSKREWAGLILLMPTTEFPKLIPNNELQQFFGAISKYAFSHFECLVLSIQIMKAPDPKQKIKELLDILSYLNMFQVMQYSPLPTKIIYSALFFADLSSTIQESLAHLFKIQNELLESDTEALISNIEDSHLHKLHKAIQSVHEAITAHKYQKAFSELLEEEIIAEISFLDRHYMSFLQNTINQCIFIRNRTLPIQHFAPLLMPHLKKETVQKYMNTWIESLYDTTPRNINLDFYKKGLIVHYQEKIAPLFEVLQTNSMHPVLSTYQEYGMHYSREWILEDQYMKYRLTIHCGWQNPETRIVEVPLMIAPKYFQEKPVFTAIFMLLMHLMLPHIHEELMIPNLGNDKATNMETLIGTFENEPMYGAFLFNLWENYKVYNKSDEYAVKIALFNFFSTLKAELLKKLLLLSNKNLKEATKSIEEEATRCNIYIFNQSATWDPIYSLIPQHLHGTYTKGIYMYQYDKTEQETLKRYAKQLLSSSEKVEFTTPTFVSSGQSKIFICAEKHIHNNQTSIHIESLLSEKGSSSKECCLVRTHQNITDEAICSTILAWHIAMTKALYYKEHRKK